jgi:lactate permease
MWHQSYGPFGNPFISAAVAALPIVFFLAALTIFKVKGFQAALMTLVVAAAICIVGFGMPPTLAFGAALFGVLSGLWPIGFIILSTICLDTG